ncbi:NAD(P)-dependent oxidoreductase [soil metagenome]
MTEQATRIAIVGLGNMGAPMAQRWISAGFEMHGFDTAQAARDRFAEVGGTAHDSASAAVSAADVVVFMLPSSAVVDSVLDGLLESGALRDGMLVIDMGSSQPLHSIANRDRLAAIGVDFIDAPVSGGVRGVIAGTLAIMVGGNSELVRRAEPLLSVLGNVTHVGETGAGHAAKALNNLVSAAHLWMTSEAVLVAKRFGIEPQAMVDLLNASTGRSVSSEVKWPKFILTESYDSGFQAALLSKDALVATELTASLGLPPLLGEGVAQLWSRLAADLPAGADHTEVARWIDEHYDQTARKPGAP